VAEKSSTEKEQVVVVCGAMDKLEVVTGVVPATRDVDGSTDAV